MRSIETIESHKEEGERSQSLKRQYFIRTTQAEMGWR